MTSAQTIAPSAHFKVEIRKFIKYLDKKFNEVEKRFDTLDKRFDNFKV